MRNGPAYHGRTHSPGGTDPIPGMGGSGIQFDTYPQDGTWLYAETTGSIDGTTISTIEGVYPGVPFGLSMLLLDSGGGGIMLYEPYGGNLTLKNDGGDTRIESYQTHVSGANFDVHVDSGMILDGASGGITIDGHDGNIFLNVDGHAFAHSTTAQITMSIAQTGDSVIVVGGGSTALFEIRGDGSVHGLASVGAITWDL